MKLAVSGKGGVRETAFSRMPTASRAPAGRNTVATDAESNANPATGSGVGADGAIVATPGPEAQRPAVDDILADLDRHG